MKVLLTGDKGYIGTVLGPMLLERGHEVTGLDSDLFADCTYCGELADINSIEVDVRDADPECLKGFDAVIHLAGLSNDPLGDYNPGLTQAINTDASVRLAKLAKAAGVPRFLFASSCSTYGAAGESFLDETARFNPVTPYGQSKVDVEKQVSVIADDSFSPTYLRASTAYGLSPRLRFDLVVNNLVAWAFTTGEIHLKSDGSPWRPLVHVRDIALAYISVLEAPLDAVHMQAFNVGSTAENYQMRDVAEIVSQVVPGSKIGFADGAGPDTRNYRVDCNRISLQLHGFKPQWTVRRGVEELYDAFYRNGLELKDFEGERYKRIAHIQKMISNGSLEPDLRRASAVKAHTGTGS
jgi:nucleoside-diphosphate-sugar epimerase